MRGWLVSADLFSARHRWFRARKSFAISLTCAAPATSTGLRALASALREPSCPLEEVHLEVGHGVTDEGGAGGQAALRPVELRTTGWREPSVTQERTCCRSVPRLSTWEELTPGCQRPATWRAGTALARALRANAAESRLRTLVIECDPRDEFFFGKETTQEFEAALAARWQHLLGPAGRAGGWRSSGREPGREGRPAARGGPGNAGVSGVGFCQLWSSSRWKLLTVVLPRGVP